MAGIAPATLPSSQTMTSPPRTSRIVTLAMNPVIDSSSEAAEIFPTRKVRTSAQRYDPGGGGINVARVLARLGDPVEVVCLAGGVTGNLLDELLAREGLARNMIRIADNTRMNHAVFERASGLEYRFVNEGPLVAEGEWTAALELASSCVRADWLVASGSLPRNCPSDFYARLASRLAGSDVRLVIDTYGPALAEAVEAGGIFLAKPSQDEFEELVGRPLANTHQIVEAAQEVVAGGKISYLAVTMGASGAILAHTEGVEVLHGLPVDAHSATGAGDSFVAGMVHGFLAGESARDAFRWGLAAGSAAVLSPGTGLCDPVDVKRLLGQID